MVACLAAAVERAIDRVAVEDLLFSFRTLFSTEGHAINAASILPGLLRDFGDVREVLAQIAPEASPGRGRQRRKPSRFIQRQEQSRAFQRQSAYDCRLDRGVIGRSEIRL